MKSLLSEVSFDSDDFDKNGKRLERAQGISVSADEVYSSTELRATITRHIESLPEAHRSLLMLRDIEGYSIAETAELLEISHASVKTGLHRARNKLRKLLENTEL